MHSEEVAYHGIYSHKGLESAVKEHLYPPAIQCVVMYQSPPDCSGGVKMNKLIIKGAKTRRIDFPFKVYKVKSKCRSLGVGNDTLRLVQTQSTKQNGHPGSFYNCLYYHFASAQRAKVVHREGSCCLGT